MGFLDFKNWDPVDISAVSGKILAASLVLWFTSGHLSTRLPAPADLDPQLQTEPEQHDRSDLSPFEREAGEHAYSIQPKAEYKIRGLIVATHDSSSLLDLAHQQSGDFFNSHDLCVIWGENASSPYLSKVKFSHGDWTCYFETKSSEAWKAFRKDQLSNNHILPATDEVLSVIRSAQIGDQIELSGQLVDYSMDGNPERRTSLIRTDVENGACEIIYVTSAQFLKRAPAVWRWLRTAALISVMANLVVILFALGILPFLRPRPEF